MATIETSNESFKMITSNVSKKRVEHNQNLKVEKLNKIKSKELEK